MKQIATINPRNVSEAEVANYKLGEAARAIVVDKENKIALLWVGRDKYYKLPGGGIEPGEDRMIGLQRECYEEIGCAAEVIGEIGYTLEYWKEDDEKQTSYCYLAKMVGEKGTPDFTQSEKDRDFGIVWVSYPEAIELLKESKPIQFEGEYIKPRDLAFLEEAKDILKLHNF